jgi:serine phosphatase RsbU (regulator of sigma subunit)
MAEITVGVSPVDAELMIDANGAKSVIRLEAPLYRIGRDPSNQLSYPAVFGLSREHLVVEREGASWVARDVGSRNGTLVNGERISAPRKLRTGDRITAGQMNLFYREIGKYPEKTVVFTDEAAPSAGSTTITESLQLMAGESAESGRHMQAVITAARELSTHLALDKLFDLILDLSMDTAGAQRGVLMTLENGELHVRSNKGEGLKISSHVRDLVIQERRSLLVRDAMSDAALASRASIVLSQVRSIMAVPLQTDDRVIGLIYLDSSDRIKEFSRHDLSLLTVMANIAAVRIENARLAEVEQAERLRARELEHAAMIQRAIVPSRFPAFPKRKDFELYASMVPAREVGGDLFDFFLLGQDRLAFVMGDVSGKGMPAALYMAITRTLLRAIADHQPSPAACLTYMNQWLVDQHDSGMFVTVFYGILNLRTGVLEYSNAGQNHPYVLTSSGRIQKLSDGGGAMLGIFAGMQYSSAQTAIGHGDAVLAYTDGVVEAVNKDGAFFEASRLEEYISTNAARPVEELVRGLQNEVSAFEAGARRADDITVLAVRLT